LNKVEQEKLKNIMSDLFNNKKLELQDPKGNWMKIPNPFDFTIQWFINNLEYLRIID
jgi:hypothetical protein